jgi:hypothetical protein
MLHHIIPTPLFQLGRARPFTVIIKSHYSNVIRSPTRVIAKNFRNEHEVAALFKPYNPTAGPYKLGNMYIDFPTTIDRDKALSAVTSLPAIRNLCFGIKPSSTSPLSIQLKDLKIIYDTEKMRSDMYLITTTFAQFNGRINPLVLAKGKPYHHGAYMKASLYDFANWEMAQRATVGLDGMVLSDGSKLRVIAHKERFWS